MSSSRKKLVLGVDPGLSGALALLEWETEQGAFVGGATHIEVIDMPTHEITINGSKKRQVDLYGLSQWLDVYAADITYCNIERVGAMPKQGVTSVFNFGNAYGAVQGIVAAHFIPMNYHHPATWKRLYKLTSDKDASRQRASQIFPKFANLWQRAKDDGRAEAVLIATLGS